MEDREMSSVFSNFKRANKKEIWAILKSVTEEINTSSKKPGEMNIDALELIAELRGINKLFNVTRQECSSEYRLEYGEKSYVLDYIIFMHVNLFLLLGEKFFLKKTISNDKDPATAKIKYVTLMLVNLTNSLLSIRLLTEKGLDVQAKQILRSYIEYSDLAIAVLGNENFYKTFLRMGEGEKERKEIWWKFTRPVALAKVLEKIYLDIDDSHELWDLIQSIREPVYARLSDYTHGHVMAIFLGAIGEKSNGNCHPVAMGAITPSIDYTLKNSIVYGFSFIKHAMITIVKYQKMPFQEFGENGIKYVAYYKTLELYLPRFFRSWTDKVETDCKS